MRSERYVSQPSELAMVTPSRAWLFVSRQIEAPSIGMDAYLGAQLHVADENVGAVGDDVEPLYLVNWLSHTMEVARRLTKGGFFILRFDMVPPFSPSNTHSSGLFSVEFVSISFQYAWPWPSMSDLPLLRSP